MQINTIVRPNGITVCVDAEVYTVNADDSRYDRCMKAAQENDVQVLLEIIKPVKAIERGIQGFPDFAVENDVVFHQGEALPEALGTRMLYMLNKGFDVTPLVKFYENLAMNPSYRAVQQLFGFLDACNLPITEDGHFLAYKKINSNFTDVRTGTIDNSVGARPSMDRNKVNEDPNVTCSHGLHVCSQGYLPHYSGSVVVACKVHPKDVVAVPTDYNNAKMRLCEYLVHSVVTGTSIEDYFVHDEPAAPPVPENKQWRTTTGQFVSGNVIQAVLESTEDKYLWLAMDSNGGAFVFTEEPEYFPNGGWWDGDGYCAVADQEGFADDYMPTKKAHLSLVKIR